MDRIKRQRPCLERACKSKREPEAAGPSFLNGARNDPLEVLSPKLWRNLPVGLAYKILSFLPVDRLVDTLRRVIGRKLWQGHFLTSPGFSKIFGHGNNLTSSYGFVTLPNRKVPRFAAFEHESKQWREFPRKVPAEVKQCRLIIGGSEGLLLCESKKCRSTNLSYYALFKQNEMTEVHYPDIGVWNPLLQSFKWLPQHPQLAAKLRSLPHFNFVRVMVDEQSKTYKVFLQYTNVYSVYNSTTRVWSRSKMIPRFASVFHRSAACSRYIFFDGVCVRRNDALCRYDVQRDSWDRLSVSKVLTDLDCSTHGDGAKAWIDYFAILRGNLYALISGTSEGIVLASMDLSMTETPTVFKLETIVPVPSLPYRGGLFCAFNMYTYTLKGKDFVCLRTSSSGHFLHFDVSRGDWLASDAFPDLARVKNWLDGQYCCSFKPSFVVP